jgi:hypothetical protein
MSNKDIQVNPQYVINSLLRQISELAQKLSMLEAIIDSQNENANNEPSA